MIRASGIGLLLLTAISAGIYLLVAGPDWFVYREEFREGRKAIQSVESFKATHGRLPATLGEAGDDARSLVYEQVGDEYKIMFSTLGGDPMVYDSTTGQWR